MTLYFQNSAFAVWRGEVIDGIRYPRAIEQDWPASDLEAIGLWRDDMIAPADPVPEGKVVMSRSVRLVDGVVRWVNELGDAPKPEVNLPPLTARRLRLGLIAAGISISSVDAAIAAIENDEHREVALVEWEYASQFERNHHLIEMIGSMLGMTIEQIDTAWLAAASF